VGYQNTIPLTPKIIIFGAEQNRKKKKIKKKKKKKKNSRPAVKKFIHM